MKNNAWVQQHSAHGFLQLSDFNITHQIKISWIKKKRRSSIRLVTVLKKYSLEKLFWASQGQLEDVLAF